MEPNDHIREFLNYYCSLKHAPHYAVLLTGKWGSGKTWFIKDFISRHASLNKRILYVSLYGLQSFADIEGEFFRLLHPVLASKKVRVLANLLKGTLKGTLRIDVNGDGKSEADVSVNVPSDEVLKNLSLEPDQILVFDDLERCSIPIGDLLGYINQLVEHVGLKAILIANEEEIVGGSETDAGSDYRRIKEKLIGRTFEVAPEVSRATDGFIANLPKGTARTIAEKNKAMILRVYESSGFKNLRLVRHALEEFHRLAQALDRAPLDCDALLVELLERYLILSFEVRSGEIKPEEITKLNQMHLPFGSADAPDPDAGFGEIRKKYGSLNSASPLVTDAVWETVFTRGAMPRAELNECLHNSRYLQSRTKPNWVNLWHGTSLSDEEFREVLAKVEEEWNSKHYKKLGVVIHVTGLFIRYARAGLYPKTPAAIIESANAYIGELLATGAVAPLEQGASLSASEKMGYKALGYASLEDPDFKCFLETVEQKRRDAFVDSLPVKAQQLLEIMTTDSSTFTRQVSYSGEPDNVYFRIPILKFLEAQDFFDRFMAVKADDKRSIASALRARYSSQNFNRELVSEAQWMASISTLVSTEAHRRVGTITGLLLSDLQQSCILPALQMIEKTQGLAESSQPTDAPRER